MEANLKIIEQMCEEQGINASPEAKEALVNFAVLFGEKLVRNCIVARPIGQKVSAAEIKKSYELLKNMHSPEYEAEIEARMAERIRNLNAVQLLEPLNSNEDRNENTAKTAVTVKLHNSEIYHMSMSKEHQLTYE